MPDIQRSATPAPGPGVPETPQSPLSFVATPFVLPAPYSSSGPPIPVHSLSPLAVRSAVQTWIDQLPISTMNDNSRVSNDRRFDLSPYGMEFLTRDFSFRLNPRGADIHSRGFVHAAWGDSYVPTVLQQFLPLQAPPHYAESGVHGEARVWSDRFLAAVTAQGGDGVAGAVMVPHAGSLFGSYSRGRWQIVGERAVEQPESFLDRVNLAFSASNDQQHLRLGLLRPGASLPASEGTLPDLLCGCEFFRGPNFPSGAVAGWFGGPRAQVCFRYDLDRERLDAVGNCDFIHVPTSLGAVSLTGGFDTRNHSANIGTRIDGDGPGSTFRRHGIFNFGVNPHGQWGVTLSAMFDF